MPILPRLAGNPNVRGGENSPGFCHFAQSASHRFSISFLIPAVRPSRGIWYMSNSRVKFKGSGPVAVRLGRWLGVEPDDMGIAGLDPHQPVPPGDLAGVGNQISGGHHGVSHQDHPVVLPPGFAAPTLWRRCSGSSAWAPCRGSTPRSCGNSRFSDPCNAPPCWRTGTGGCTVSGAAPYFFPFILEIKAKKHPRVLNSLVDVFANLSIGHAVISFQDVPMRVRPWLGRFFMFRMQSVRVGLRHELALYQITLVIVPAVAGRERQHAVARLRPCVLADV